MYVPPETDAVCDWHSVDVAACAPVLVATTASTPPSVSTSVVRVARTGFLCLIRPPSRLHKDGATVDTGGRRVQAVMSLSCPSPDNAWSAGTYSRNFPESFM